MADIVELESGTDPVKEVVDPGVKAKNETEEIIQRLMQKAYVLGMSTGMRTMCGSILEKLNQSKNLNPQKQLMALRQWCNSYLTKQNSPTKNVQADQTTNTQNNIEKENNNNEEG